MSSDIRTEIDTCAAFGYHPDVLVHSSADSLIRRFADSQIRRFADSPIR